MDFLGGAASEWRLAGRVRRRRTSAPASAATVSHERIEELDRELVRFARSAGRLRLELGRGSKCWSVAAVARTSHFVVDECEGDQAQRAWEAEPGRMREDAERLCEERMRNTRRAAHISGSPEPLETVEQIVWEGSGMALDAQLRAVAAELDARELGFGRALELFFEADGWRRLGHASAAHYARERLGVSLSSAQGQATSGAPPDEAAGTGGGV